MSQVNTNPDNGYPSPANASRPWNAALIAIVVGFVVLLAMVLFLALSQAGLVRPIAPQVLDPPNPLGTPAPGTQPGR